MCWCHDCNFVQVDCSGVQVGFKAKYFGFQLPVFSAAASWLSWLLPEPSFRGHGSCSLRNPCLHFNPGISSADRSGDRSRRWRDGLPQAMHSDRDQCLQPSGHPHSERLHEMEGCPVHSHGTDFESHLKERCFRGGYDHAHFAIVLW